MGYSVRKITLKDNEDPWFPKSSGKWEVVDDTTGKVVYRFRWSHNGDYAEWDNRDFYTGPMSVRISPDGKWVLCVMQTGVNHGIAFAGTLGEKVVRHPLPPTEPQAEEE
ncbi:MAG: hypothetical protein H6839_17670 [Planctomycetes bacterium]|nr:hypothetical protein [Planctomycetota bacterium]